MVNCYIKKGNRLNVIEGIEFLENNSTPIKAEATELDEKNNIHIFHPNSESFYNSTSLLTIDNEQGIRTMKISEWLVEDPVSFHTIFQKHKLKIDGKIFEEVAYLWVVTITINDTIFKV